MTSNSDLEYFDTVIRGQNLAAKCEVSRGAFSYTSTVNERRAERHITLTLEPNVLNT